MVVLGVSGQNGAEQDRFRADGAQGQQAAIQTVRGGSGLGTGSESEGPGTGAKRRKGESETSNFEHNGTVRRGGLPGNDPAAKQTGDTELEQGEEEIPTSEGGPRRGPHFWAETSSITADGAVAGSLLKLKIEVPSLGGIRRGLFTKELRLRNF